MKAEMERRINFICNNEEICADVHPGRTLLDFLRDNLVLKGTKEGCREGDCGACTVLIGSLSNKELTYKSVNSCLFPANDVNGKHVVTIEGLNKQNNSTIQNAFIDEGATQCGFCTPGFIVSLTGYFLSHSDYTLNEAVNSMDGNICRCTGHVSIIRAVGKVLAKLKSQKISSEKHIKYLISEGIIPDYFDKIKARLTTLQKMLNTKSKIIGNAKFNISGGTDLYVQKWDEIYKSKINFLSSSSIPSNIVIKDGECIIGANATVSDVMESNVINDILPHLKKSLLLFGSLPIRNRATVGGNIVNASPIADLTIILLALNAELSIKNGKTFRKVKLNKFYKGYKKINLKKNEFLYSIKFKLPAGKFYFNFEKVSQRTYLDIASVNSSFYIKTTYKKIDEIHLSAGGVAPIPLYLRNACSFLLGEEINSNSVLKACKIINTEISPISDVRGSAVYKRLLLRQLLIAHFIKLFPEKIKLSMIK